MARAKEKLPEVCTRWVYLKLAYLENSETVTQETNL